MSSTLLEASAIPSRDLQASAAARQAFQETLEVPAVRQNLYQITVEQYHALVTSGLLGAAVELLDGVLIEKMSKSPLHSSVAQKLVRKLRAAAKENLDVRQEQPITCKTSEPEPDLALVEAEPDDYASGHPTTAELIIEITISSASIDRHKAAIYAGAGVREYWIVLPESRQIEQYTALVNAEYTLRRLFSEGQTVQADVLPAFQVALDELFPA